MAHAITGLGGLLFDRHQFQDLLNGTGNVEEQDLLATLMEGESDEQQGSRSALSHASSGEEGGTVLAAAAAQLGAGGAQPRHSGAAAGGASHQPHGRQAAPATGGGKKRKKQQQGISAAQVNALEKEYLQVRV